MRFFPCPYLDGEIDNLFIFTIGSLLPLGFTDGSTLLHWWGKP